MPRPSAFRRWLALSILSGFFLICTLAYLLLHNPPPFPSSFDLGDLSFWVVDESGKTLFSSTAEPPPQGWWESRSLAARPKLHRGKQPMTYVLAIALRSSPPAWAVAEVKAPLIRGDQRASRILSGGLLLFLLITLNLAISGSLLLVYSRRKGKTAEHVLAALEAGDLSVRFPITRADEPWRLMAQFNRMADKIESLVKSLREAETARTRLLRELAHDVRTPLTALRAVVETVRDCVGRMQAEEIEARMEQAEWELTYFERLFEDLFLLAELGEPKLHRANGIVDLAQLVGEEVRIARSRVEVLSSTSQSIQLAYDPSGPAILHGEAHLLRRLIRNALENALEHSGSRVEIFLRREVPGKFTLVIRDDGPGLDATALESFGHRRASRYLDGRRAKKISLELGSVIMKAIVEGHHGTLSLNNRTDLNGTRLGAELKITLPVPIPKAPRQSAA